MCSPSRTKYGLPRAVLPCATQVGCALGATEVQSSRKIPISFTRK